jgi:thioesterase domain-containing protein
VARRLVQLGQPVGQLVLLDAVAAPGAWLPLLHRIDPRWAALSMLPALRSELWPLTSRRRDEDPLAALSRLLALASRTVPVLGHHLALWRRHAPGPLDVPAVSFVPEQRGVLAPLLGPLRARRLAIPSARLVQVPGDHTSMLSAGLAGPLGDRIQRVLDAADRAAAPPAEPPVHALG